MGITFALFFQMVSFACIALYTFVTTYPLHAFGIIIAFGLLRAACRAIGAALLYANCECDVTDEEIEQYLRERGW